jgi:hypothetical protein
MAEMTISQLNRIGERLRNNLATEKDLRSLDEFRLSFQPAYDQVFAELSGLGLHSGGRPQKTTSSMAKYIENQELTLKQTREEMQELLKNFCEDLIIRYKVENQ